MTAAPTPPGLSLRTAAFAACVDNKVLSAWISADTFRMLHGQRRPGAWTKWHPADVLRAAVTGWLLRWGLTHTEAATVVAEHIDSRLAPVTAPVAWPVLLGNILGHDFRLHIVRGADRGLTVSSAPPSAGRPFLTIDVAAIARECATRLANGAMYRMHLQVTLRELELAGTESELPPFYVTDSASPAHVSGDALDGRGGVPVPPRSSPSHTSAGSGG